MQQLIAPYCIGQQWPNFLTWGPNQQLPGHWKAGYSVIYIIYAKIGY